MRRFVACVLAVSVACVLAVSVTACGKGDGSAGTINQLIPGATVYIDGWNEDGKPGDQALVEYKPKLEIWIIPANAPFAKKAEGRFTYAVTFVKGIGYRVVLKLGQKAGIDHDNCLATDGSEMQLAGGVVDEKGTPVSTKADSSFMEKSPAASGKPNDDCYRPVDNNRPVTP